MPLSSQELQSKLWQAADILRGQIDAADYKNYIFSILFLKRLSDRFNEEVEDAVTSGVPREVALADRDEHEVFVPEEARWPALDGFVGRSLAGCATESPSVRSLSKGINRRACCYSSSSFSNVPTASHPDSTPRRTSDSADAKSSSSGV